MIKMAITAKTVQSAAWMGVGLSLMFSVANGISTWYLDEPLSDWVETKVGSA
jgi:hypothetical protein